MSVSITISNLEDDVYRRLQAEAERRKADIESVAKSLLSQSLPSLPSSASTVGKTYRDASSLAGTWTDEEAKEFLDAVADCRKIDKEMWE